MLSFPGEGPAQGVGPLGAYVNCGVVIAAEFVGRREMGVDVGDTERHHIADPESQLLRNRVRKQVTDSQASWERVGVLSAAAALDSAVRMPQSPEAEVLGKWWDPGFSSPVPTWPDIFGTERT